MLKDLIVRHETFTGSPRARWILDNWQECVPKFVKVFPHEYKRVLGLRDSEIEDPEGRLMSDG